MNRFASLANESEIHTKHTLHSVALGYIAVFSLRSTAAEESIPCGNVTIYVLQVTIRYFIVHLVHTISVFVHGHDDISDCI